MIKSLLLLLLACTPPANAHLDLNLNIDLRPEYDDSYAAELDPFAPRGLKVSYLSSVVIQVLSENGDPMGSGSGNYFKLGKHRFILTAAHVVSEHKEIILIEKSEKLTKAKVIYLDPLNDLAVLVPLEKLRHTKAIPFRRDINNQMGEKVYHCGHPAFTGWHLSEGILSGTREDVLLVNTFAWPGSSGSVMFDESGRVLGVLSAVRVDLPFVVPDLVEHIVLVSNIKMLNSPTLKAVLRDGQ
mgnify:CR=1 FL=1